MAGHRKSPRPEPGERYGNWEVLSAVYAERTRSRSGREYWRYYVRCRDVTTGESKPVDIGSLVRGLSTGSPGAALRGRDLYGYAAIIPDSRLRERWLNRHSAIMSRCYEPTSAKYADYGGRGIDVCQAWHNRAAFLRAVIKLPDWDADWGELDRTNNDRGYHPDNVRIVSRAEQCRNTRVNSRISYNGVSYCAVEFWERFAPLYRSASTVARKIRDGLSADQIIADQAGCRGAYS